MVKNREDIIDNLTTSCWECNQGKNDTLLNIREKYKNGK